MNFRFLCTRHRVWLTNHPEKVHAYWMSALNCAQRLISMGSWYPALHHAGCALEAARLMVGDARHCDQEWISRHRASEALWRLVNARLGAEPPAAAGSPETLERLTLH